MLQFSVHVSSLFGHLSPLTYERLLVSVIHLSVMETMLSKMNKTDWLKETFKWTRTNIHRHQLITHICALFQLIHHDVIWTDSRALQRWEERLQLTLFTAMHCRNGRNLSNHLSCSCSFYRWWWQMMVRKFSKHNHLRMNDISDIFSWCFPFLQVTTKTHNKTWMMMQDPQRGELVKISWTEPQRWRSLVSHDLQQFSMGRLQSHHWVVSHTAGPEELF